MDHLDKLVEAIDSKFEELDLMFKHLHVTVQYLEGDDYLNLRRETCDVPRLEMRYYLVTLKEELNRIKARQSKTS